MNLFDTSEQSPVTTTAPGRERAGGRLVLMVVLGLGLLLGGAYAAAYYNAGDKVPRGTTVSGVEVGGLTPADAATTLEQGLADRVAEPIAVSVGGDTVPVDPAEAGLGVDHEASVAEAGGGTSWAPGRLWDYYTGGDDLEAVVTVDDAAMAEALTAIEEQAGTPARDGAVTFRGGRARIRDAVVGRGLDATAAAEALEGAFLTAEPQVDLSLVDVQPDIDADDVAAIRADFVNPAMSGPVTLVFGKSEVLLRPQKYAAALSVEARDGVLEPALDTDTLSSLVEDRTSAEGQPVDATVALVNGKPQVVPAKPGVTYEPGAVADLFLDLVTAPEGERSATVKATVDPPEFTTKDARALKVREKVSEFTTYYPYAEYRNTNIGRAAEIVDGTLLKPGDVFSLNDIVGERTAANGFVPGFIISNGIFKEDYGGGVSQMATTLFNGMFFAGLKDVEHKPHSFYIDRYPVGREATVAWGAVDLRFENDTDYGVLIESKVTPATPSSQGVVRVAMYSTKVWDITTDASERYAYVEPATRTLNTPDCYPNSGYSGFQIDVFRYFKKPGESDVVRTEKFHTVYTPSDTVICKPPPQAQ